MAIETIFFTAISYGSAIVLFIILGWYFYMHQCSKHLRSIPGPTPLPVIGNVLMFTNPNMILQTFSQIFHDYGNICKIWIGTEPIIVLADYKAVETLLSSTKLLEKAKLYKFFENWLGGGLLTSTGAKWKRRRKMLTPSYHFQILEQFVPTFNKVANSLVEELRRVEKKDCLNIFPFVSLAALDVICETAMGVPVNALQNKDSKYVKSVKEMGRITMERALSAVQQFNFLYAFTKNCRLEKESLKVLHGHTLSVIKKRKEEMASKQVDSSPDADEFGSKKKIAFLDQLLNATDNGVPLSEQDIEEEVNTFMFEGHDTTAAGISFTLYEIAKHAEVQRKILEEQDKIFGSDTREPTYQDLSNMRYLEMVIKEGLRLYPSVPLYARTANEDTQISDEMWVPKGCSIVVNAYCIHRNPQFFPEPEKFLPERFDGEANSKKMPFSYVPFSAGPRNCIGQKFAFLELKSTISKIVRHFELSPVTPAHKMDLAPETILKSNNGILIKINERIVA